MEYEWEGVENFYFASPGEITGNATSDRVNQYFANHTDHSLRGTSREFTFRGPYKGTQLLNAIVAMDEAARVFNFRGSFRTSLHVHLDVQDLVFPDEIVLIAVLYALAEPFIFKFIGSNRDSCNYCLPWYGHPQHYETFVNVVKNKQQLGLIASTFKTYKQTNKYSGMNFFSLGDYGSLEFRHAPVTLQLSKIITWINIIMRMKKYVLEHKGLAPGAIIRNLQKYGPPTFFHDVFDFQAKDLLKFSKHVGEDSRIGIKTAYHFLSI